MFGLVSLENRINKIGDDSCKGQHAFGNNEVRK